MTTNRMEDVLRFGLGLWTSFLGAPIVWLIQFQAKYALVPWAFVHGNTAILHITAFVFLLIALGLVGLAWRFHDRCLTANANAFPEGLLSSGRFMSLIGIFNSSLFALLIAAQAIPAFLISPCVQ
jgi:hypothetical protein